MAKAIFEINCLDFEAKALEWAQQFNQVCYLQSNGYTDSYATIESLLAVDALSFFQFDGGQTFEKIELFKAKYPNQWMLGFFSYDLKNEIENLNTLQSDQLNFPEAYFFIPKTIIKFTRKTCEIDSAVPTDIFNAIVKTEPFSSSKQRKAKTVPIKKRISKAQYYEAFDKMMSHIKRGDIYEVNLCQEFYAEDITISPLQTYHILNTTSPTPFATFFKIDDKFILSASPERFLAKRGDVLISQPIKGTAARGSTKEEDLRNKQLLRSNPKEISENVMIVDLVRNDMTLSSKPGTVDASNILEVHSFKQVHQLISTITGQKRDEISDIEALKNLFPPGSMTGAPKISAMRLCDTYEKSKRGVYSGAVGYFSPEGDFDFNVIIRTILYNQTSKYLSFHTGGALTYDAKVEDEYNECLLKASAITSVLNSSIR